MPSTPFWGQRTHLYGCRGLVDDGSSGAPALRNWDELSETRCHQDAPTPQLTQRPLPHCANARRASPGRPTARSHAVGGIYFTSGQNQELLARDATRWATPINCSR